MAGGRSGSTRAPRTREDLSKMVTFMNMVIIGVENWSPDMIPVAFERKLNEKLDEIPPGIYRPHMLQIIQYRELTADTKTQKWS